METPLTIKQYRIPQDILLDVLRIMFQASIKHKITAVKSNQNTAILRTEFDLTHPTHKKAQDNLLEILQTHEKYMKGLLGDNLIMNADEFDD